MAFTEVSELARAAFALGSPSPQEPLAWGAAGLA